MPLEGPLYKRKTPLQYKGVLNLQTNIFSLGFLEGWVIKVELEGIEPSSKRGMNTLSTCLSLIGIVGDRCADRATNNHPLAYEVLECCPIDLAAPSPEFVHHLTRVTSEQEFRVTSRPSLSAQG